MTVWEFACMTEGFKEAQPDAKKATPAMSNDRLAELGIEGF